MHTQQSKINRCTSLYIQRKVSNVCINQCTESCVHLSLASSNVPHPEPFRKFNSLAILQKWERRLVEKIAKNLETFIMLLTIFRISCSFGNKSKNYYSENDLRYFHAFFISKTNFSNYPIQE